LTTSGDTRKSCQSSAAILVNRHCSSTATTDFSREKWLADSDYDANPAINAATVHTLARCEWIEKGEPGTGKTHLLIGLGSEAAQDGLRVRYTLATKLVNELFEAADERQLAKTIARYGRVDLLCIDLFRPRDYAEPATV
jgi:DNA replication protein DnaC